MKNRKKLFYIGFSLLTSFLFLLIASQNSPFYPLNEWVDANAFMTVGKGMMHGLVPYKDLFEQKGPLLYLIYGIGYLMTNSSFLGVFVLEVVSGTVFLYYGYKIISLFINEKYSLIILPLLMFIICSSSSFCHGGSAEEFSFPFLMISFYYLLNYFKNGIINNKIIFINGLIAGSILMIKYLALGFWFSFMMFIFFDLILKKDYKKAFKYCFIFLCGMLVPFILFSLYFLINGAFFDFVDTYFLFNIKLYSNQLNMSIIDKIVRAFSLFKDTMIIGNGYIYLLLFGGLIFFVWSANIAKKYKLFLLGTITISILLTYYGGVAYIYYPLIWFPFIILFLIFLGSVFDSGFSYLLNKKYNYFFIIIIMSVLIFSMFKTANYNFWMFVPKEKVPQYQFGQIIKKDKDKTLLNYGFLDYGVYFQADSLPTIRDFEIQNIDYKLYPYNKDNQNKCIREKCVNYVVMTTVNAIEELPKTYPELFKNYNLIKKSNYYRDYNYVSYLLFKQK